MELKENYNYANKITNQTLNEIELKWKCSRSNVDFVKQEIRSLERNPFNTYMQFLSE